MDGGEVGGAQVVAPREQLPDAVGAEGRGEADPTASLSGPRRSLAVTTSPSAATSARWGPCHPVQAPSVRTGTRPARR